MKATHWLNVNGKWYRPGEEIEAEPEKDTNEHVEVLANETVESKEEPEKPVEKMVSGTRRKSRNSK